eukprot:17619-Heterococcus_DN1.PRE.1
MQTRYVSEVECIMKCCCQYAVSSNSICKISSITAVLRCIATSRSTSSSGTAAGVLYAQDGVRTYTQNTVSVNSSSSSSSSTAANRAPQCTNSVRGAIADTACMQLHQHCSAAKCLERVVVLTIALWPATVVNQCCSARTFAHIQAVASAAISIDCYIADLEWMATVEHQHALQTNRPEVRNVSGFQQQIS